MGMTLTDREFSELVDEAVQSLPEQFTRFLENVIVDILPLPDRRMLASLKIRGRTRLLGLYQGVPLTRKSVTAPLEWPERIYIFKKNIEAICDSRQEVVDQVRLTVLHEIGHHFGMDENDLDKLGYG